MGELKLLDCTLRDGAYVLDAEFGEKTIRGIIKRLHDANLEIIECGWLKDFEHKIGTSFYHVPSDLERYLVEPKSKFSTYVAMIDYNRYDLKQLPPYDGKSIDAIRVVFPRDKVDEGIALVKRIREKGYLVYLQAANTFGYSDCELLNLAEKVNKEDVVCLSIVDTFGAMYERDLLHILSVLDRNLRPDIGIGFHSHNNHQLSFALSMKFADEVMARGKRNCIVDASLVGMGRGAGNTPTEMISNYLNLTHGKNYDENAIMDTIDVYMKQFIEKYKWGYSVPYMLAGTYGCHVNNIKYLTQQHRANSKDMKVIFEMMAPEKRTQYDYDNLEKIYSEYQSKKIDDEKSINYLKEKLRGKKIVAIAPGRTAMDYRSQVKQFVEENHCTLVGINAVVDGYDYDFLFFGNAIKFTMAMEQNYKGFKRAEKIVTSNVETDVDCYKVNYDNLVKRNWKYYDNSLIMFLRLMSAVVPEKIYLVGFDGFTSDKEDNYANILLENHLKKEEIYQLHRDVEDMFRDYLKKNKKRIAVEFLTPSVYAELLLDS